MQVLAILLIVFEGLLGLSLATTNRSAMKTFLNVIGLLASVVAIFAFLVSKSAVHEIEGGMAILTACLTFGLARIVELSEQIDKRIDALDQTMKAGSGAIVSALIESRQKSAELPPVPDEIRYFVRVGKETHGPLDTGAVRRLQQKGTITPETWILRETEQKWRPLAEMLNTAPFSK